MTAEELTNGHDTPTPAGRSSSQDKTILLVEDEKQVRALTREIFLTAGYRVLEAEQGPEALALSERHQGPIHLLVTDLVMPRMSGRELADRLIALHPGLSVLLMSGYPDDYLGYDLRAAGYHVIQKPFSPEALLTTVRTLLDRPRSG